MYPMSIAVHIFATITDEDQTTLLVQQVNRMPWHLTGAFINLIPQVCFTLNGP